MGKINQGILGGVSGKVGNIIGGNWKGIDYIRIKPSSVANPRTKGQVEQRTKFSTVLAFLQPMTDFLKTGFKLYSSGMTQFNAAMSYNLGNAVLTNGTDISIDYPNALVSRGNLTGAVNGAAVSNNPAEVVLNWDNNSDSGSALATDKALIVILNTTKGEAIYTTAGPLRSAVTATMSLPVEYSGDKIEVYLGFISDDGSRVSNSAYLGSVTVA
ncbi:hypothetical protein J4771_01480 [Candidatus Kaistella beijingensis]|uniref:DUF6266 family protein n=1 Tax=Candidatus Kaistella beijingensis TaxID=2820270 RepID=UPI001CC41876|nr:DUF6266 family protein [Candidatus Kaistella beijingensis]UBB90048.1 hypothetical protein J4771_01480 [Candidatus Kaistella beijingensis]